MIELLARIECLHESQFRVQAQRRFKTDEVQVVYYCSVESDSTTVFTIRASRRDQSVRRFLLAGKPGHVGDFQNNWLVGARGGYYLTKNFEVAGNYSWSNHFQPKNDDVTAALAGAAGLPQGRVRANIWEAEFSYNLQPKASLVIP